MYNPATGQREIEPFQAEIVRRIFTRFAELRSFDRVCTELNEDGIPTFDGGRWYPIGVRRMLQNESYTGRLIYRRTRWIKTRGKDGQDAPQAGRPPGRGSGRDRRAHRRRSLTRRSGSASSRS